MNIETNEASKSFEENPFLNEQKNIVIIHLGWKTRRYYLNTVKDLDAPIYYSQGAISFFSIFFGVIFGAGMLAVNVKKANHKNVGIWIVLFGVLYTIAEIIIFSNIERSTPLTFFGNALGVVVLDFFWHRYIGYDTLYRTKAIWKPLIIALVIYIPIMALIIMGINAGV